MESPKQLKDRIAQLDRFLGSLYEYNQLKGQEFVVMDTGLPKKFVMESDTILLKRLISLGCEALVRYNPYSPFGCPYGIPVKRK